MEWKYYNHAMIPNCAPHDSVELENVIDGTIWKNKNAVLARWTSDWDCGYETEWWYTILDTPFDINKVNAKRRYEIKKGNKFFDAKVFCAYDIKEEYYAVDVAAYSVYPEKYRPSVNKEDLYNRLQKNVFEKEKVFYGAFSKETGELCGYVLAFVYESHVYLSKLRVIPKYEKMGINAFLINFVIEQYNEKISKHFYICDGERNISHETAFQDYLEKYFGFRKAYCKLNVEYRPLIKFIIPICYKFKRILRKLDGIGVIHMINSVLKMEEVKRKQVTT